jgi:hypothetical protein
MQVSHESPLALLEKSRTYNDYDYCLVHLLEEYPEYLAFFKESKPKGRKVLLDNSMFELREAFEPTRFTHWINELSPDEYIVPDVFSDKDATIESFKSWQENHEPNVKCQSKKIGVVQGKTYQEMIDCYRFLTAHADKIAFSFECLYFHSIGFSLDSTATKWHRLAKGRQKLIEDLCRDGIWAWHKPHHLLGCALPQEFARYSGLHNIESIDTSNPVVAGLHGTGYNEHGLDDKIETKLADMLDHDVTEEQLNLVLNNVRKFRQINLLK